MYWETKYGRENWKRWKYGISSADEIFNEWGQLRLLFDRENSERNLISIGHSCSKWKKENIKLKNKQIQLFYLKNK